mmetsp:Transcript_27505/g.75751  ORF Transcript_27505/g.75751 Transcript_27505/m.75751 type:complete len:239 (+) Transcript_27505:80-796(+)
MEQATSPSAVASRKAKANKENQQPSSKNDAATSLKKDVTPGFVKMRSEGWKANPATAQSSSSPKSEAKKGGVAGFVKMRSEKFAQQESSSSPSTSKNKLQSTPKGSAPGLVKMRSQKLNLSNKSPGSSPSASPKISMAKLGGGGFPKKKDIGTKGTSIHLQSAKLNLKSTPGGLSSSISSIAIKKDITPGLVKRQSEKWNVKATPNSNKAATATASPVSLKKSPFLEKPPESTAVPLA